MNRQVSRHSALWSRRTLLKASAAALSVLPALESLGIRAPGDNTPANAQEAAPLQRLVLMFNPNGTIQEQFWPTVVRSESDFDLSPILTPLQAHQARLLLLKGLSIGVANTGPGGPHQKGTGGLFTGNSLQAGSFKDGDGAMAGWANGLSIDQAVVNQIGQVTLLPSLELGVRASESEVRSRIVYAGPGAPLPPENDPQLVFQRLFSGFQLTPDELERQRAQRLSVLDTVKAQFGELQPSLSAADRARLDQHLEMVRSVEHRLDLLSSTTGQCSVPAAPPVLAPDDETTMATISRLQLDLLAMAFACDATRVASVQYSNAINSIRFPWLNSLGQGHTLSHAAATDTDATQQLVARAAWHAGELAYFMDTLAAMPEGAGSALDNTLIVWGNELGVGNSHNHDNIPFLLAGGGAGFTMGRFLTFNNDPHNRLLVAIQNAFGIPSDSFGHPDYATGTLAGLT
jgi:hypothetical protein